MENDYSYALTQRCSLDLYPEENAWHYITVQPTVINKIIETHERDDAPSGCSTRAAAELLGPSKHLRHRLHVRDLRHIKLRIA